MAYDIYGNNLKRGHCEVHPQVAEEYPCSLCYAEHDRQEQNRQEQNRQEQEYYKQQEKEHYKQMEKEPTEIDMTVSREYLENKPESILQEAERLINGDRREAYGDAKTMFDNIAKGWSVIFGKEVTGKQVALAMAWLKICRENNKSKRDNIVDGAAYLALIEKL